MQANEHVALSHQIYIGPRAGAWALARSHALPIQHMVGDGRLVLRWIEDGRRRQRTIPAALVRVLHTGMPFFLD